MPNFGKKLCWTNSKTVSSVPESPLLCTVQRRKCKRKEEDFCKWTAAKYLCGLVGLCGVPDASWQAMHINY